MTEHLSLPTVLGSLYSQHLSPQWHGLLLALGAEFESQLNHDELRKLMFRVGQRFAANHPLPVCASMHDLTEQLNARWAVIQWGCVELTDEHNSIGITHYGAPLRSFGPHALTWACAFLQGAYQAWLEAMGATALSVVRIETSVDSFALEFRLLRLTT